ncbi:uncharacterized protein LOC132038027 [Lycium ferocissimum]|uniref:uncharacterized protein LOC132038027 n=1 Tax=Lycium ferocissimum TaxID=112874 RepID=UPI002816864C|nr:uncharacterized protein LOC132038027 [Lycium ferocissimum]
MSLFQTKVRFLGHNIEKGNIIPINRSIEFASKFPDNITNKTQLQRFLGSLNYISPFYKDLAKDTSILYDRLKKNPKPWTDAHTQAVQKIKRKVNNLPCLTLANPNWQKIIETDASDIGYGGILKQLSPNDKQEYLVDFTQKWNNSQKNYATVAKEILAIVKCVLKFQGRGPHYHPPLIEEGGKDKKERAEALSTEKRDNMPPSYSGGLVTDDNEDTDSYEENSSSRVNNSP